MATISKIRLANIIYENGQKRYNDQLFDFAGKNGAILLENGGGKTVLIQTILQTVLPNHSLAGRKLRNTLVLDHRPAHIAVEWIIQEKPRRYAVTAISLYLQNQEVNSHKYVYIYGTADSGSIEHLPFSRGESGARRAASADEIVEYYKDKADQQHNAHYFVYKNEYQNYLADELNIYAEEFLSLAKINNEEGGVARFFDDCKTTSELVYRLLIPTVQIFLQRKEKESFADLYAKKRENLRKYKECKQLLVQNHQVLADLDKLINSYKRLQESMVNSENSKRCLKAYYDESVFRHKECSQIYGQLNEKREQLVIKKEQLKKKIEELKISQNKIEFNEIVVEYEKLDKQLQEKLEQWDAAEKELNELRYLERRNEKEKLEQEISSLKKDLDGYYKRCTDSELKENLQEVNEQLHWHYNLKEERLKNEIQLITIEKSRINQKINLFTARSRDLENDILNSAKTIAIWQTEVGYLQKQQELIARDILSNYAKQSVPEELDKLQQELIDCAKNIALEMKIQQESKEEQEVIADKIRIFSEEKHALDLSLAKFRAWFLREQEDESVILTALTEISAWKGIRSLYEDSTKIVNILELLEERFSKEKERALLDERKKTRLADDYSNIDFFMMNPEIKDIFARQDIAVESGTIYLRRLIEAGYGSQAELLQRSALWPFILVVQPKDRERLLAWLERKKELLSTPVWVMVPEEINELWQNEEYAVQNFVQPDFWQYVFAEKDFAVWREELLKIVDQAKLLRMDKENALSQLKIVVEKFKDWQIDYPESVYKNNLLEKEKQEKRYQFLEGYLLKLNSDLAEIKQKHERASQLVINLEQKSSVLAEKIKKANQWVVDEKKKREKSQLVAKEKKKSDFLAQEKAELAESEKYLSKQMEDCNKNIAKEEINLGILQNEELYLELQSYSSQKNVKSEASLKAERINLRQALADISTEENILQEKITKFMQDLDNVEKDIESYGFQLAPDLEFPFNGLDLIRQLQITRKEKNIILNKLREKAAKMNSSLENKKGRLEQQFAEFEQKYGSQPEILLSVPCLESVQAESREIKNQIVLVTQEIEKALKVKTSWEEVVFKMDKADGLFTYLDLEAITLNEKMVNDFVYNPEKILLSQLHELKEKEELLNRIRKETSKVQENLVFSYEHENRMDERFRRNLLQGLSHNNTYSAMKQWVEIISNNLKKSNDLIEETISKQDEDLQQLITRINQYLSNICDEIKIIEKMTMIKLEQGNRTIYELKVPEWEESVAKEKLLYYFTDLEDELSSDKYLNQEQSIDALKIRKRLDEAFTPKKLFNVICPEKRFSVNVRKILNQKTVLDIPIKWENSNNWSGGEKWSKNMALFLGIQKYLAEKNNPLANNNSNTKMVILDNPFGQASSDHLLEPVFFIAERLNFQIIALTALAGGSFIRNYFPVVYSCRLRERGNTSVMTTAREMQEAYFADREPTELKHLRQPKKIKELELID